MRDGQVVDADHDDRVQDDHLTQKHDFFLGTLTTEDMPTIRINFVVLLLRRHHPVISTSDSAAHEDIVDTLGYLSTH